jgi:hypothetical protein
MWGHLESQASASEGDKRREKPRRKACWHAMFDNLRGICPNNGVRAMALMRGGTVLPGALSQRNLIMSEKNLAWAKLDEASLPANLKALAQDFRKANAQATDAKEKLRKALEKRFAETGRLDGATQVLRLSMKFGVMSVAKDEAPAKKETAKKPTLSW